MSHPDPHNDPENTYPPRAHNKAKLPGLSGIKHLVTNNHTESKTAGKKNYAMIKALKNKMGHAGRSNAHSRNVAYPDIHDVLKERRD